MLYVVTDASLPPFESIDPQTGESIGFDIVLLEKFNTSLDALRANGTLAELEEKWLGDAKQNELVCGGLITLHRV